MEPFLIASLFYKSYSGDNGPAAAAGDDNVDGDGSDDGDDSGDSDGGGAAASDDDGYSDGVDDGVKNSYCVLSLAVCLVLRKRLGGIQSSE